MAPVTWLAQIATAQIATAQIATAQIATAQIATAQTPSEQVTGEARTLLLQNGGLLTGTITSDSESYIVHAPAGGRVRIPRDQVALLADHPAAAYHHLASHLLPHDVTGRVDLIQWCLRHRQTAAAAEQIAELKQIAPTHPELERLSARLKFLIGAAASGVSPPAVGFASSPPATSSVASPPGISDASLKEFARQVQPLLLNACGTAGCHGRHAASHFQLASPVTGSRPNHKVTHTNLAAVMQQIDYVVPNRSPLLRVAAAPHAGRETPVLAEDDRRLAMLSEWIESVAGRPGRRSSSQPPPSQSAKTAKIPTNAAETPTMDHANYVDPFDPALFNQIDTTEIP